MKKVDVSGENSIEIVYGSAGERGQDGRRVPYLHDPALVPMLARLADAACEGVTDPNEAGVRIKRLAVQEPPIDQPGVEALFRVFTYVLEPAPVDALPDAKLEPLDGPSAFPAALRDAGRPSPAVA